MYNEYLFSEDHTLQSWLKSNGFCFLFYAQKTLQRFFHVFHAWQSVVKKTRSQWRLKRLLCEPAIRLRKNQNKENETNMFWNETRVPAVVKICSGKFEWRLPILGLP